MSIYVSLDDPQAIKTAIDLIHNGFDGRQCSIDIKSNKDNKPIISPHDFNEGDKK